MSRPSAPEPAVAADPLSILALWLSDACFTVGRRIDLSAAYLALRAEQSERRDESLGRLKTAARAGVNKCLERVAAERRKYRQAFFKSVRGRLPRALETAATLPKLMADAIRQACSGGEDRASATEIIEGAGRLLGRLERLLAGFPIKDITRASFRPSSEEAAEYCLRLRRLQVAASAPVLVAPEGAQQVRWSPGYPLETWGGWFGMGRNKIVAYFKDKGIKYERPAKGHVVVVLDDLPDFVRQRIPK